MISEVSTPVDHPARPARGALRFDRFATGIIYVVTFALGATSAAQPDLWWLLRAGKDFWHTGHVVLVDHYSHTAAGRYWPNHEWLWETIAYALHHVGGMPLLSAWTGLTVAVTAWVMRRSSRATGYAVPLILGALVPLMSITWTSRPQVTSQLLFATLLLLLIRERYAWIPPLFLLWANLHGEVVTGCVVLGAVLLVAGADDLQHRSLESRRRLVSLAVTSAAAALATLMTPLGLRLWAYVLGVNGRPGQGQIVEWGTIFHSPLGAISVPVLLIVTAAVVVWRRERLAGWESRVPIMATVAMAPLAILAVRTIPFLVIAVVPVLMTVLEFHPRQPIGIVSRGRETMAAAGLVTAAVVTAMWVSAPPALAWHPVPAAMATALRQCPGPLYNDYNEGAALIWFVPDLKVFADNRRDPYPGSVVDLSMRLPASDYPRTFAKFGIACALLPREAALVAPIRRDGWTATYDDGESVVLVRPDTTG